MQEILEYPSLDPDAELAALSARYRAASGVGIRLLNAIGGQAEDLTRRLPAAVQAGLGVATEQALTLAMQGADRSRRVLGDQPVWVNTAALSAMGAAGGFGGLKGTLLELPATTALLLRAIQGVSGAYGFDPSAQTTRFDCVRVLAAAGPLAHDDGSDLGFYSLRLTLTGSALQSLISAVAPRLSVVMGQKLAAQAVPVLGAVAGASSNYVYARYYQQIAHVHFGLRRLALEMDTPIAELAERLQLDLSAQV